MDVRRRRSHAAAAKESPFGSRDTRTRSSFARARERRTRKRQKFEAESPRCVSLVDDAVVAVVVAAADPLLLFQQHLLLCCCCTSVVASVCTGNNRWCSVGYIARVIMDMRRERDERREPVAGFSQHSAASRGLLQRGEKGSFPFNKLALSHTPHTTHTEGREHESKNASGSSSSSPSQICSTEREKPHFPSSTQYSRPVPAPIHPIFASFRCRHHHSITPDSS